MIRRTIRSGLRRAIRAARKWLAEEPRKGEAAQDDAYAYPLLNSIHQDVMKDRACARRPNYAWGVIHAAHLARAIGISRISVVEFGVAGGTGLIALERIAERVEKVFDLVVDVYGFDSGRGLPGPEDYRDCPNLYTEGTYLMDKELLLAQLRKARLVLGLVEDTVPSFIESKPSPVGFVSFDLDLYTSTVHALRLLAASPELLLPRVHCYFDDITGFTFGDYNGERLAISDFNKLDDMRKISQLYGLRHFVPASFANHGWVERFYMAHIFDHQLYGRPDGLVKRATLNIDEELSFRYR